MNGFSYLFAINLGGLLVQLVAASGFLVDKSQMQDLNEIDICRNTDSRIRRLSTIQKLADYFELSSDETCKKLWLKPLQDLQKVLDKVQVDACGQEAVDEIHNFHWTYVVGTLSKSWRKASKAPLPELLGVFFMNLINEITELCKFTLSERLEKATISVVDAKSLSDGSFGFALDTISIALVAKDNVKKYDDFFLIVESLLDAERKKGKEITEEVDPNTGEVVSMSVKLRDASKPYALQQQCRHDLRPVYANTVLPVMKLIDMGYGKLGDRVGNDNELLKNWYALTQICQLILSVRFHSSSSLNANQISLVTKEEAKLLPNPAVAVPVGELPPAQQVPLVHLKDTLTMDTDDKVIKKVKSNMKSRGRIYRKTFRNVVLTLKSKIKSAIKSIFISKRKNNQFIPENDAEQIQASLDEAEEKLRQEELNELEPDKRGLVRSKRGLGTRLLTVYEFILFTIIVIFLIKSIILSSE